MTMIDDTLLVAYVDGELDPKLEREIAAEAEKDPAVRERILMFSRSSDMLREALSQAEFVAVPPALEQAAERMAAKSRFWQLPRWPRILLPVAAALAGFMVGNALDMPNPNAKPVSPVMSLMGEVAEYHQLYMNETTHLVEVPGSRKTEIESWLGSRIGLNLKVPDLTAAGLNFAGARMLAVDGEPVAQLIYTRENGERVALCAGRSTSRISSIKPEHLAQDGLSVYGASKDGHAFILVGPSDDKNLSQLSANLPDLMTKA